MINSVGKIKRNKYKIYLGIIFILIVSGCSSPKIADDLLTYSSNDQAPLVRAPVIVFVEMNPKINNIQQIDRLTKESLELALKNSNIFTINNEIPYKLSANILTASQPAMSFGSFNGKLEIKYTLSDSLNNIIFTKSVYTEAGSDKWLFSGAERSNRARAVNISKNVREYIEFLKEFIKGL